MTRRLDRPQAIDVGSISLRHSLTTQTLISMGLRVTLVVFAVSILSYWHIVQTLENQTYDKLAKYIQERGEKESIIFEQAQANQQVFKQQFLLLNAHNKNTSAQEFDQLFEKAADGTTRMHQALFDGRVGSNGMISRHNSAFIGATAPLNDQAFRDRLVNAYRLLDRFGPTYRTVFENVYASFPENAIIVHWQEQAWGSNAQTDMNVHEQEWFTVANKTNNPFRQSVWTGSYYDDTAKQWMVSCETPIDYQGQHLLTVGHDYLLNTLFERVFNDKLEGTYNYIFREDGRLIAHPDKVDLLSQAGLALNIADMNDPQLFSQYQQVMKNIKGIGVNTKVFINDEQDAFIAVSKIKGPDWWFVTYFPKQLLSSTALDAAKFIFILSLISLIVELVMLFMVLRYKIVGPLKTFVAASTQVTQGHYDEVASGKLHLPEKRNDEVGLLARMLRIMAQRINNNVEEMKHLDQLKDDILANTSHELKTPLNGIVGIAESLLDGAAGQLNERQAYNLNLVVASGQRLTNLVNDILDFSKLKQHELELQMTPLDIKSVVNLVVDVSRPLVNKAELTLINQIDDDVPTVYADENRVQQILYNLVGNAIKFTDEGTIVVSSMVQDDNLVITVSDSGIGIAPNKLDSIFESFEQADGSTARAYGGTGLGLSVTKQLVELHKGKIWVESNEGQGTGFSFTLPLFNTQGDAQVVAKPVVNNKPAQSKTLGARTVFKEDFVEPALDDTPLLLEGEVVTDAGRILIVDDEPINLQVLQNHLRLKNYQITTAASGQEAIAAIEGEQKFDAVLLDVMMPGMTGFEVCRQIRRKYPTNQLPVLMVTAKDRISDLSASFGSGANDFLTKPVAKVELLERLKTQIAVVRLNDDLNQANFKLQQHAKQLEQEVAQQTGRLRKTNKQLVTANDKISKTTKQMMMLEQLGRSLTSSLELDKVIENVFQIVNNVLDAQVFMLGILEVEKGVIHVPLIVENQEKIDPLDFELSDVNRPAVWCVQNKKELLIMNESDVSKYFDVELQPVKAGIDVKTFIYQPLLISGKVIGCLSIQNVEENAYTQAQIEMIRTLASYAAIALANALGFERLKETYQALKDTQQQLVLQEKMASLGTLTAGVAHEINNPTNFVHVGVENLEVDLKHFEEFILELAGDDADKEVLDILKDKFTPLNEHISTVKDGTKRIKTIVEDLRAFTRLDDSARKPADIVDCLESTVNLVKTKYLEVVEFVVDLKPIPDMVCYPAKLNQMFMNLIVNGCDAIRQKQAEQSDKCPGQITITCQALADAVTVTVQDTGCGMSDDTKNKIFEPFFTTKSVGEGTGLGMAISFGIIEEHGGAIEVESTEGVGTLITVYLPVG